jgi:hypothetical protein
MQLSELVPHLTDEDKSHMKAQDGGLQTFLRNHSQAFHVFEGKVKLRRWTEEYTTKRPKQFKVSKCWFFMHHPQGLI